MNKRYLVYAYLVLLLVMLLAGCSSGKTTAGFTTALGKIHLDGINSIDAEITKMDQEYTAVLVKIQSLEQLLTAAMQWVEFNKTQKYDYGTLWIKEVTEEGLNQLKNDQYKVSKLELVAKEGGFGAGWQFTYAININDVVTGSKSDWQSLQDDLNQQKAAMEERRKQKMAVRERATSTWSDVVKNISEWKSEKYNDVTYIIKGAGLGWQDKLLEGQWAYYTDQKLVQPMGKPAEQLQKILASQ